MIAVVTGAGRGIGRAIAIDLARRGCRVALLGRTAQSLSETAQLIAAESHEARVFPCDVASSESVQCASLRIVEELGVPAIVVANAGIVHRAHVAEMTESQWDDVIDVNLKGTFLIARAFLKRMLSAKKGRIVAVSSISATLGTPRQSAYCASKWGTTGFIKSLAEELRGTGLQAMAVLPGSVDTPMLEGSGFAPAMQPEDVSKLVTFLALDAPDAMNASCVEIFGP